LNQSLRRSIARQPRDYQREILLSVRLQFRTGQRGRLLLQRELDTLVRVATPNAAIDIDQPEDLLLLEARRRRSSLQPG